MSDNNNPQPLTHMTDSVTPQPTAQDYLTNAQSRITEVYSATLKAMRDIEEAKASLSDAIPSPSNMEANMRKLIAFTWQQAMEWAQDLVDDELCKDVDIDVHIDETIYDSMTIHVRGDIEQNINIGDHFEIDMSQDPSDIANRHEEVLKEFLLKQEQEAVTSVTAEPVETSINLSKNNA
mgnify:FL=1